MPVHPLDGCRAKIRRAAKHVDDFAEHVRAFLDLAPYRVRGEIHEDAQELVFIAEANRDVPAVPLEPILVAGEVAHQLRSALDHLVWQLVMAHTGQPPTGTKSGFPIFLGEVGYNSGAPAMIVGVSPHAATRIQGAQPYHVGADADRTLLWVVHELNNTDKHRIIPVTTTHSHVGSARMSADDLTYADFVPEDRLGQRLEHGTEIARVRLTDCPNTQFDIRIGADIAFERVGGVQLMPATQLLTEATEYVGRLIESFEGEFGAPS